MINTCRDSARRVGRRFFQISLMCFLGSAAVCNAAFATEPAVRVEEDWVLQIGAPDPAECSPQILNVMTPNANLDGLHAIFELNHKTAPVYEAGGMQLQHWYGDFDLGFQHGPKSGSLATTDETVTYTLAMDLAGEKLSFEVLNGTSQTWGTFGGQGYLKFEVSTSLTDLSSYDSAVSVKYSQIGFASNRVDKFVLKEVRWYAADGTLLAKSTTEQVVHSKSDDVAGGSE